MGRYIVIDDDSTNNLICEFTIKKFDKEAQIILYQDPEKALEAIGSEYFSGGDASPIVLFLDVNMPAMSGFEFLDKFQKFSPDIKEQFIIYMLTSSIEDFSEQGKSYPFVSGFLAKPLKIQYLEEIASVHKVDQKI